MALGGVPFTVVYSVVVLEERRVGGKEEEEEERPVVQCT